MSKKLLLINDLAGYGKVALSAMIPVLSHMKYEIYSLPTAIVSNTLDYGKFEILDTTEYIKNTLKVWDELNFDFDAISTGFIVSKEETRIITELCKNKSDKGITIFTDPIMGDDGRLYNGITEETVSLMRELVSVADYIVPNYTEAAYLADVKYHEVGTTLEEYPCLHFKHLVVVGAAFGDGDIGELLGAVLLHQLLKARFIVCMGAGRAGQFPLH